MKTKESKTLKMLDILQAYGHFVGDIEKAEKLIPHQRKMVLLRFFNDWQQYDNNLSENAFLEKWQPVREYLEHKEANNG
jgi:hypothetical protein